MQRRVVIILALALISGGLAAYLAFTYLREPPSEEGEGQAVTTEVVVAERPMDVGYVLSEEDVRVVDWPSASLPSGYAASVSEVVDRGLITPVAANEPLLSAKLARAEAGGGLPITIPEGMRAMSVAVNEVIGVAGFVLPGTRVDVLVTAAQPDGETEDTQIVLQDVEVLSSGQTIERQRQGQPQTVSVVTLLVTPEQAETLTLAAEEGQLQLALRNTLDRDTVATEGQVVANLLPRWRTQPSPAPRQVRRAPPRRQVEVYRGPERSTTTVDTTVGGGS